MAGQVYNYVQVDSFAYIEEKNHCAIWNCTCLRCGKKFLANGHYIRNGTVKSCGCLRKELSSKRRQADLTNKRFGKGVALYKIRVENYNVIWVCICDCGNYFEAKAKDLLRGAVKSCGCLHQEVMYKKLAKDITGVRSGHLVAIRPTDIRQHRQVMWLCKCDCGNYTYANTTDILNHHVTSCGCINSKGEEKIGIILRGYEIPFLKQYSFKDLKGPNGGLLKFDFAIFEDIKYTNLKCLIEYQGEQHFKETSRQGFGDMQRLITDQSKRDYCKKHDIKLYEINYFDDIVYTLYDALQINDNPVGNDI